MKRAHSIIMLACSHASLHVKWLNVTAVGFEIKLAMYRYMFNKTHQYQISKFINILSVVLELVRADRQTDKQPWKTNLATFSCKRASIIFTLNYECKNWYDNFHVITSTETLSLISSDMLIMSKSERKFLLFREFFFCLQELSIFYRRSHCLWIRYMLG